VPTPDRELRYLLALRALPGLGDIAQRALLERFGDGERAWRAWPGGWPSSASADVTAAERDAALARADRAVVELDRRGAWTTDLLRADYPAALRQLHDPPAACFFLGRRDLLDRPMVAIVGSRAHTAWGGEAARLFAAQLAGCGLVVLSGLARGIDAHAHEAALAAGGTTAAVLGNGLDLVYPAEHRELQAEIATRGLLISEFLPGDPPRPHHFPRRNRLIAALALGVLVVEARADGGALITVDHALDLGRAVMAVPGPVTSPAHAGSNRLLREGAAWAFDVEDVLRCLRDHGWEGTVTTGGPDSSATPRSPRTPEPEDRSAPPGLTPSEQQLWRRLQSEPSHIDELCVSTGIAPGEALAALSNLEFRGLARQLPGMRFARG
jgi:DNA processing protein